MATSSILLFKIIREPMIAPKMNQISNYGPFHSPHLRYRVPAPQSLPLSVWLGPQSAPRLSTRQSLPLSPPHPCCSPFLLPPLSLSLVRGGGGWDGGLYRVRLQFACVHQRICQGEPPLCVRVVHLDARRQRGRGADRHGRRQGFEHTSKMIRKKCPQLHNFNESYKCNALLRV